MRRRRFSVGLHPVKGFRTLVTPQPIEVPPEYQREPITLHGLEHRGNALCGALFSPCSRYRYALYRHIRAGVGDFVVIGLNPSTADERLDDPTIRRCMGFAAREKAARLVMLNLFAFRATDPDVMKAQPDPVGALNDEVIAHFTARRRRPAVVVAAWGVHGAHMNRGAVVINAVPWINCFGRTKDGHPRHPLYLKADTPLEKLTS